MYTLFISTFDKIITIGLLKDGKVVEKKERESLKNHSVYTMPMIDDILKYNNIKVNDINEIIVINGPGSFTGVRLGVVIAKTLAYTLNIPIKTITSLKAFAVSTKKCIKKLINIPDTKGYYIGFFNEDDTVKEYIYLKKDEYEEYIKDKKEYVISDNILDLETIYESLKNESSINPHNVNPIYIKGIDALNGK